MSCHEEYNVHYIGDSTVLLLHELRYQVPLMPNLFHISLHTNRWTSPWSTMTGSILLLHLTHSQSSGPLTYFITTIYQPWFPRYIYSLQLSLTFWKWMKRILFQKENLTLPRLESPKRENMISIIGTRFEITIRNQSCINNVHYFRTYRKSCTKHAWILLTISNPWKA